MFINCPYCRALVATNPATDRPPPICPDCGGPLGSSDDARAPAAAFDTGAQRAADAKHPAEPAPLGDMFADDAERHTAESPSESHAPESHAPELHAPEPHAADTHATDAHAVEVHATESAEATEAVEVAEALPAASAAVAQDAAPPRARHVRAAPSFARDRAAVAPRRRSPAAVAAVVALSLLLGLQLLLADRARLATHAQWRPLLEFVCGALSCSLPPWREPAAFTLVQRNVRQHPTVRGALRVTATFRNDARWPQPWPRLQLSLADVDGRIAGTRIFEAQEYLGGAPEQAELGSGESAAVAMDVLEPASNIVAYDFRFR